MSFTKSDPIGFPRPGMTLVEVLVIIGILAVLITLLLPAISRTREAAAVMRSKNNLKQVALATHHFAAIQNDRLPSLKGDAQSANPGLSVFGAILPYIEEGNYYNRLLARDAEPVIIKTYLSPADPAAMEAIARRMHNVSSYAANAQVFERDPRLPSTFGDGTTNTIMFAEHYALCGDFVFFSLVAGGGLGGWRRASFADVGDIIPVTGGSPPITTGSYPGLTFQVAPARKECDGTIPQAPHRSGMLSAMGDGSVRTIAPAVSPQVFWGAVTPAGGEILHDW